MNMHLLDIGPLTGVATVFATLAINVVSWAILSGSKFVKGKLDKVDAHEVDIVVLYEHLKLERPTLR